MKTDEDVRRFLEEVATALAWMENPRPLDAPDFRDVDLEALLRAVASGKIVFLDTRRWRR